MRYTVQTPDGRKITLEGDHAPTEQDLMELSNRLGIKENTDVQPSQKTAEQSSFLDTLDKTNDYLRKVGGAVEAFDRGRYLGFGKKAGGLANAVLSYPFDRAIEVPPTASCPPR